MNDPYAVLSPRQLEVLKLMAAGLTRNHIALRLGIKPTAVNTHQVRIAEKMGNRGTSIYRLGYADGGRETCPQKHPTD